MMKRNLDALSGVRFDLVIIGGGVNGAAVAREAALRGLKVALIEAGDFAGGTSSRSSKLIHGGLRYLAQGEIRLVREARLERRLLAKLAPHLVEPVPFLLPVYRGDAYSPVKLRLGLSIYDWMGNLGPQDRHRFFGPVEVLRCVPRLRATGLRAGAIYYDSITDDARLCLEYALDAADHGAAIVNYAEVRSFTIGASETLASAEVVDRLTGRQYGVASRFWINAAGPWVDRVRALLPGYDGSKTIRMTKGTHVILPCVSDRYAILAPVAASERVFLMMPWHGHSLLGTTDTEYEADPAAVRPDRADGEYLLGALNRVLRDPIGPESILGSYAGLRALVVERGKNPSANTREYRFHRDPWAKNLISVCGGKLTTSRALGEKLMDVVVADLSGLGAVAVSNPSRTAPLPGGHIAGSFADFVNGASQMAVREFGVPLQAAERLVKTYGSRWRKVLDLSQTREPLPGAPALLEAEVLHAIRQEMAITLEDVLLRRSGLSWMAPAYPETAEAVSRVFARELSWTEEDRRAALDRFERVTFPGGKLMAQA